MFKRMSHLSILVLAAAFAASAEEIALETAGEAAQAWVDGGYSLGTMRGRRMASGETVEAGGAKVHVVRFEGGGFVAMGADDLVDPVIAFSPSGKNLSRDDRSPLRAILGADLALRARAGARQEAGASAAKSGRTLLGAAASSPARTESQRRWDRLLGRGSGGAGLLRASTSSGPLDAVSDVRVEPLVKSRWGQENNSMYINYGEPCFNYYTPNNYPCGCVATAMAQIMRYHRYPASATAKTKECKVDSTNVSKTMMGGTYDYDSMPLVPTVDEERPWYEGGASEEERKSIGKLTYDCGVAMQMWWKDSGSASGGAAAGNVMKNTGLFKYKNAIVNTCTANLSDTNSRSRMIYPNLDAGMPVMLGLADHQVIADGYGYSDGILYTHLNMGWADECDVWYALPEVYPTVGDYSSSVVEVVIYNIFPTLTGEIVSGRVIDADGNPVVGASVTVSNRTSTASTAKFAFLTNVTTSASGVYSFITGKRTEHFVMASFGSFSASANVTPKTSQSSSVTLAVGSCTVDADDSRACGNVWGCDLTLTGLESVSPPVFEPGGCVVYPGTNVIISCATPGAVVHYTVDGATPDENSDVYSGPIEISSDTLLKARAFADGMNPSSVVAEFYDFDEFKAAPPGDFYAKPIVIRGVGGTHTVLDNSAFGIEKGEANHTQYYQEYRSCWYRWKSPGTGVVTVTTRSSSSRYLVPTAVAVYSDGESVPTSVDTRLAMASTLNSDYSTTLTFNVAEGKVYMIVGMQLYDEPGSFTLSWVGDLVLPHPKPTVIRIR